jgi:hypothetical protein
MQLLKILCFSFLTLSSFSHLEAAPLLSENKINSVESLPAQEKNIWKEIKGTPSPTQINAFMWTYHFSDLYTTGPLQHKPIQANDLFALTYRGITAGTFLNTQYDRTYFVALSRQLVEEPLLKNWQYSAGYRIGLMYGYGVEWTQEHLGVRTPILPIIQVFTGIDWHGAGVEVAFTAPVLVSLNFYFRF